VRGVEVGRERSWQLVAERELVRVDVRERDPPQRAVLVEQVHGAPVASAGTASRATVSRVSSMSSEEASSSAGLGQEALAAGRRRRRR
jgi:hypothetical protein